MSFSASNTYASLDDLKKRVTRHGYVWASDTDDGDGFVADASAEADYPSEAMEYANGLVDEALVPHVPISPRPANGWLHDRAIDIAAARLFSLGGRNIPASLQAAYDDAKQKLEEVRENLLRVPGLDYSQFLDNGRRRGLPVRMLNLNGCRR